MNYGSVCSGVESATLAWEHLGWKAKFFAEVEPFPSAVLCQKFGATRPLRILEPDEAFNEKEKKERISWSKQIMKLPNYGKIPNLGDFTKIEESDYNGTIDFIVGGTPCQSYSLAGLRKGLADPRGNLALEFVRLAYRTKCRWICWENVIYANIYINDVMESFHYVKHYYTFLLVLLQFEILTFHNIIYINAINPLIERIFMENQKMLNMVIDDLKNEFLKHQFSESKKYRFFCELSRLSKFANRYGYDFYTPEIGELFKEFRCKRKITDKAQDLLPYQKSCRQHIRIINHFYHTGTIHKDIKIDYRVVPLPFKKINDLFLEFQKSQISPSSWLCCERHTYRFLCFLDELKISDVKHISGEIISKYCQSLREYDNCTIHTYLCDLRSLFRYLYEYEFIPVDLIAFIPKFRLYQDTHIPTTWSTEEISQLLSAISRTDPIGKRDYAMILLIATLGLRISDVINLKFSNLNWRTMKISLIQKKNCERIELPLQENVAWAIIDYLQNGRPKSNSEYVFLKHKNPVERFSEHNSFWVVFVKYLKLAGLPRKRRGTAHSMRHSLASRMLDKKIQLSDIADALGHTNVKSTIGYLKININDLRSCCLSFLGKRG